MGGIDTRALVRHIRDRGAMLGGVFPGEVTEREARTLIAAEPPMSGRDLAAEVTPPEPIEAGSGRRAAHRRARYGHQELDRPQPDRARRAARPAAVHHLRLRRARTRARRGVPRQRARRSGRARARGGDRARPRRQGARVRHLPRPPAAVPRGRPRDVQAAVRPPGRQPPGEGAARRGGSRSPRRTTASRSSGRTASSSSPTTVRCAGRRTSARPSSRT